MISKEEARKKITLLIERFDEQKDSYKRSDYNETLTRRDFIDPFFKALGWDINNEQGYAESYREVIHEDKIKIGSATKAPDYSFRLGGGKRLFFVEAKKPSVYIKGEVSPAYQVRRYGWSAKLPISIITDFEEFAIYDCTKKPNLTDKASHGRIKYLTYQQYIDEFDFLWDTFSKEKVLKGSFDKFVQSDKLKKGTTTVDRAFLTSLDSWRTFLAGNIALRNTIAEDELNYVVQHIIDRIIFLRIAEDRRVEHYGTLQDTIKTGTYYENLLKQFYIADQKYNSGLFDFKKDKISAAIQIDNKIIKSIISDLYYPISPYEFSVISVEILGSAYEQFLGKTISLSKSGRAIIEEKPEVRKAGGVYYTPQYIVDYIVQHTVGAKIKELGKKYASKASPAGGGLVGAISKIKIVDPACGSGSFLIGAYQYLLDYHKDFYTHNGKPGKGAKGNPLTPDGNLTTSEKKRILLNNIFGVDLDANAVEVTKLSLLLKCMEGETEASINSQLQLFHERVLPTLDDNIKDGNSLIDIDFYGAEIDFGEEKKIKPFNWQKAFPEVFQQGGFDCVIGNPPYVMLQNLDTREVFDYTLKNYNSAKYKIDTYQLFIERSIEILQANGIVGMITPNTFLKNIHSEPLRKFIIESVTMNEILLFNYSVFTAASVDTCVFIFEKKKATQRSILNIRKADVAFEVKNLGEVNQFTFLKNNRTDFNLSVSNKDEIILAKINKRAIPLGNLCGAYFGIQTFDRKTFVSTKKENSNYQTVIDGGNIAPYYLQPPSEYVNYIPSAIKSGGSEKIYRQDRICIRQIGATPIATFVPTNIFTLNTIYNVYLKEEGIANLKFLLGIINSRVTKFFWKKNNSDEKKTFPKIKKEAILSIPVPDIANTKTDQQAKIIKLVDQLLLLNEEKYQTTLPSKISQIQNHIDYCEQRIDEIVYALYGLTKEEIEVVEGG